MVQVFLIVVLFAGLGWYAKAFGHGTLGLLRERGGLERCLFQVGIGVSLFQLYDLVKPQNDRRRGKLLQKLLDAAAALIFIAIFFVFTYTNNDLYFVLLAGALIFCLSLSQGPFSNFLSLRPMVLLGKFPFPSTCCMLLSYGSFRIFPTKRIWDSGRALSICLPNMCSFSC
jgi:peptidoglycan/LPS O-acetylase OafA/YrhL